MESKASSGNAFACDLLTILAKETESKNIFISPASITLGLSMALLGSRNQTRAQMIAGLKINDCKDEELGQLQYQLVETLSKGGSMCLANQIYLKPGLVILETYRNLMNQWFKVTPALLKEDPKESSEMINSWVSEKTKGMISSLVDPSDFTPHTAMLLVNAVHFKSNWMNQFDISNTEEMPFHINESTDINVRMMYQKNKYQVAYHPELDFDYLELPYVDRALKMAILLPREVTGIGKLLAGFNPKLLDEVRQLTNVCETKLWLPTFKIEESYSLGEILVNDMGMSDVFTVGTADFSGISEENLAASGVIHKAVIEVKEEGTEAAAATAVIMVMSCMASRGEVIEFRVDHQCIFAILGTSDNSLAFVGLLRNP